MQFILVCLFFCFKKSDSDNESEVETTDSEDSAEEEVLLIKGATSRFEHLEKFSLNFSS